LSSRPTRRGVTDAAGVLSKAVPKVGKVDTLVYAAGGAAFDAVTGVVPVEGWWGEFAKNLRGRYNMFDAFIRATNGVGTIANLVSLGASFTMPGSSAYSIASQAAIKLGECLDASTPPLILLSPHTHRRQWSRMRDIERVPQKYRLTLSQTPHPPHLQPEPRFRRCLLRSGHRRRRSNTICERHAGTCSRCAFVSRKPAGGAF
jgi:hypothetical protein